MSDFYRRILISRILMACCFCLVMLAGESFGAERKRDVISLEQAIETAVANSRQRKVSQLSAAIADAQYREALSYQWPTISLSANIQDRSQATTIQIPAMSLSVPINFPPLPPSSTTAVVEERKVKLMDKQLGVYALQAQWPVFTGGKISSLVAQAQLGSEAAQSEFRRTSLEIVRDTKKYYLAAIATEELLDLAKDTRVALELVRDFAKLRHRERVGSLNKIDYLRAEIFVSYLKSVEQEINAKHRSALAALEHMLGNDWIGRVQPHSIEAPSTVPSTALERLIQRALEFNPQLEQLRFAVQIADQRVAEAESGYYPKVAFLAEVRRVDSPYDGGLMTEENRRSWTLGISMTMPILDSGATASRVSAAKTGSQKTRESLVLVEEALAAQIRQVCISLEAARQQIAIGVSTEEYAVENARVSSLGYLSGSLKPQVVLEAQIMSALAKAGRIKAQHEYASYVADLEYMIAGRLGD